MKRFALDARVATAHFPGIGRYVSNLARELPGRLAPGEQLLLFHTSEQALAGLAPEGSEGRVIGVATAVTPFSVSQQWQIPRQLLHHGATLYHSPYYLMPYRLPAPAILTFYDLIPQRYPEHVSWRARLLFRLATRLALRAARHVIAISEATRRDLLATYPLRPEQVTAIPLAADPHFYPRSEAEMARVREKYRLPSPYVLYLGINKPHKNLLRLVEGWRLLLGQAEAPLPSLVVAGAWDARYPQARQAAEAAGLAGSVRFVGPIAEPDLPALYSGALLFVFPSLYEGFGLPVVEAMACGTAVACSNLSSLPEVAGEAAYLFDPRDPAAIAAALRDLLQEPARREALQAAGKERARRFSWQRTAQETIALYREL
jgi:glycosyltransferase involved in cell wall biosynthesis